MESAGMIQVDEEISQGSYLNHYFISIDELKWLEGQKCAEAYDAGDPDDADEEDLEEDWELSHYKFRKNSILYKTL